VGTARNEDDTRIFRERLYKQHELEHSYRILVGKPERKREMKVLTVDDTIILNIGLYWNHEDQN
jgi:hypothetical protein